MVARGTAEARSVDPAPASEGRVGRGLTAGCLGAGCLTALALVLAPLVPPRPHLVGGAVLLGFALGWALLFAVAMRFGDRGRAWAVGPAAFLGVSGLVSVAGPGTVRAGYGWVWPPLLLLLVGWLGVRAHRLGSRRHRWLAYAVLTAVALAAVGGGYETVRERLDRAAYPAPGQLIDVGGHRLHLACTGSGSPTVVVEPGLGESAAVLGWIVPDVARTARVCVYDRPGRGWSDPAAPADGTQVATDLHTLLERAGIPGPYVLAGHSFGGLYILCFAAQFPHDVAGMVLLDSTAPGPPASPPGRPRASALDRASAVLPGLAHLGLARLMAQSSYATLPARSRGEARASASTAAHVGSFLDELGQGSAAVTEAGSLRDLGAKPLLVITAAQGADADWLAAQAELVTRSTNAAHRVVDTTHADLVLDRDQAARASRAILDVITAVRTSGPVV